jgi:hypothetical protein
MTSPNISNSKLIEIQVEMLKKSIYIWSGENKTGPEEGDKHFYVNTAPRCGTTPHSRLLIGGVIHSTLLRANTGIY